MAIFVGGYAAYKHLEEAKIRVTNMTDHTLPILIGATKRWDYVNIVSKDCTTLLLKDTGWKPGSFGSVVVVTVVFLGCSEE